MSGMNIDKIFINNVFSGNSKEVALKIYLKPLEIQWKVRISNVSYVDIYINERGSLKIKCY